MAKTTASREGTYRFTNVLIESETGETQVGGGEGSNLIKPVEVLLHNEDSETEEEAHIGRRRSTGARKRGSVHILFSNGQRVILPHYSKPSSQQNSDQRNKKLNKKSLDCGIERYSTPMNTTSENIDNRTSEDGIEIIWQSKPYQYLAVVLSKRSTSSARLQTAIRYAPEVQVPLQRLESAPRRVPQLKHVLKNTPEHSIRQRELLNNESLLDEESSASCEDHDYEFDDEVSSGSDAGGLALITKLATCAFPPDESSDERLRLAESHLKQPIYMFRVPSSSTSTETFMEWDVVTSVTTVSSTGTSETAEEASMDMSTKATTGCCTRTGWFGFRCGAST